MAEEDPASGRAPGWREVLILASAIVVFVLALDVVTSGLPEFARDVLFRTPLAIAILIVGTVGLLLWVVRGPAKP